jgi:hypothetical protein
MKRSLTWLSTQVLRNIPISCEEINEKINEEGKILMKNAELNEIANTESIHSVDVRNSSGKVVFSIIKGCKSKGYTDGNSTLAWDKVKKKFDPVSVPSLIKIEIAFRKNKLEKGEDLEIEITNIEELCLKPEDMNSHITGFQFMVQVHNGLTNDYELHW